MQDKILTKFLWLYIICATIAACFVYGIIAKANGDNVEHLHSSWLIWQGFFSASQSVNVVFGSAVRRSADKSVYDFFHI